MNKIARVTIITVAIAWTVVAFILPPVMTGIPKPVSGLIDRIDHAEADSTISMEQHEAHLLVATIRDRHRMMLSNLHLVNISGMITLIIAAVAFFSKRRPSNNGPSVQMTRDVKQSEDNHRAGSSAPQP